MAIFSRYVLRQTLSALVLILASLTTIAWISLALRQLRIVTTNGQDAWTFLVITTLTVPNMIGFVAPVALLIATLHVLNRLNGDSELIILTASGGTVWWVARPLLVISAGVAALMLFINFYGMPQSLRVVRELVIQVRSDLITQVLQPGRFSSPMQDVTIHVRDRTLGGQLQGILFHDARNPKDIISITADRGRIIKTEGEPYLQMSDGYVVRQEAQIGPGSLVRFDTYTLELDGFERKTEDPSWKPRERFFNELMYPEPDDAQFKSNPGKFRAELHERLSNPLYPIAFVLIALASIGQAQSTRSNRTQALVTGFVAATVLRLMGLTANNLVTETGAAVPLLYAVPILGGLAAWYVMHRNARPRMLPAWLRGLQTGVRDTAAGVMGRLARLRVKPPKSEEGPAPRAPQRTQTDPSRGAP